MGLICHGCCSQTFLFQLQVLCRSLYGLFSFNIASLYWKRLRAEPSFSYLMLEAHRELSSFALFFLFIKTTILQDFLGLVFQVGEMMRCCLDQPVYHLTNLTRTTLVSDFWTAVKDYIVIYSALACSRLFHIDLWLRKFLKVFCALLDCSHVLLTLKH